MAREKFALSRLHPLGLFVGHVVPAQQVQDAVHHEQRDFVVEGALVLDGVRAAIDGQITMSPMSWGISGGGGSLGPVPPASGTRPVGSGSPSMGKLRTSVGPSLPMNCWFSDAMVTSSEKIRETSASPRIPSSTSAPLASAIQRSRSIGNSRCSSAA